ncbi:type IV pili methyl-accepting chemotaxis transducer N-terminal domain-containing protein [Propionivibrio limicola]|uniref:type IV pili methyl-accepting chemotaxis transducer N-terminal domain-containing protein n=1 Tax=Propionivibrio limicola TaxID=167645 RepID=UPI00147887C6|nr:type IV pili methyl-accepting chemotaxis transducer N-terminal domain-containing protein [Propionivibrio limicola]
MNKSLLPMAVSRFPIKNFIFAAILGAAVSALGGLPAHAAPLVAAGAVVSPASPAGPLQHLASAGQLRLQAQRLAKLYQQSGMNLKSFAARQQAARARQEVEQHLAVLSRALAAGNTQRPLARTSRVWGELKKALDLPFSLENRDLVNALAEEMSIAAGSLAMQIEGGLENGTGRLLDLSLRQSMLVQRLARLYLQAHAGDRRQGLLVDMEQARKEFSAALKELLAARENTAKSRDALELAKTQWVFFEQAVINQKDGWASNPKDVATASERILEVLDDVCAQYAPGTGRTLAREGGGPRG